LVIVNRRNDPLGSGATKMATWAQVQKRAKELGAEAEIGAEERDAYVYSPQYTTWNATGGSILVVVDFANESGQTWKAKAFAELLERMQSGVSDDPDADGWWVDED
jgi:predicted RNA-binding protein (virulence factor B family)